MAAAALLSVLEEAVPHSPSWHRVKSGQQHLTWDTLAVLSAFPRVHLQPLFHPDLHTAPGRVGLRLRGTPGRQRMQCHARSRVQALALEKLPALWIRQSARQNAPEPQFLSPQMRTHILPSGTVMGSEEDKEHMAQSRAWQWEALCAISGHCHCLLFTSTR